MRCNGVRRLSEVAHGTSGYVEPRQIRAERCELHYPHLPERDDVEEVALPLDTQVREVGAVIGQVGQSVGVAFESETPTYVEALNASLMESQYPTDAIARHEVRPCDGQTRDGDERGRKVVETFVSDERATRHVDVAQQRTHERDVTEKLVRDGQTPADVERCQVASVAVQHPVNDPVLEPVVYTQRRPAPNDAIICHAIHASAGGAVCCQCGVLW